MFHVVTVNQAKLDCTSKKTCQHLQLTQSAFQYPPIHPLILTQQPHWEQFTRKCLAKTQDWDAGMSQDLNHQPLRHRSTWSTSSATVRTDTLYEKLLLKIFFFVQSEKKQEKMMGALPAN